MTSDKGFYCTGLTDGEGYFVLRDRKTYIEPSFGIGLRADDRPILEWARAEVGVGTIKPTKNAVRWSVYGKYDCLQLVELFDNYPLRTKKRRDWEIWREVVSIKGKRARSMDTYYQTKPLADKLAQHRSFDPYTPTQPLSDYPGFEQWFPGFVDAEGSFMIQTVNGTPKPIFKIGLRKDDKATLEGLQQTFGGMGRLHESQGRINPITHWVVDKKLETDLLAAFFRSNPLRAKKASDLKWWSKAITARNEIRNGGDMQTNAERNKPIWDEIRGFQQQLHLERDPQS